MKWSRQFLSCSITGTDTIVLWTQGDGTWLSDKISESWCDQTLYATMHLHVENGGHEDATHQVKQGCHRNNSYYASLLQSRMCSTCAALWHHRNSFQQTQIMGNTNVCMPSSLELQPHYSNTPQQAKYQIWYNKSLDSDLINYVKTLQTRLQDDRKQTALCLCDPGASGWHFKVADPTSRYIDPLSH